MNCDQVPPIGPGVGTVSPDDCGFYFKGYNEVPSPPMPGAGNGPAGYVTPSRHGPFGPLNPGNAMPQGAVPESMEELPAAPPAKKPRRTAPDGALPQLTDGTSASRTPPAGRPLPARHDAATARRVATGPAGASPSPRPNRINRPQAQSPAASASTNPVGEPPAFIGPTGYDVNN